MTGLWVVFVTFSVPLFSLYRT